MLFIRRERRRGPPCRARWKFSDGQAGCHVEQHACWQWAAGGLQGCWTWAHARRADEHRPAGHGRCRGTGKPPVVLPMSSTLEIERRVDTCHVEQHACWQGLLDMGASSSGTRASICWTWALSRHRQTSCGAAHVEHAGNRVTGRHVPCRAARVLARAAGHGRMLAGHTSIDLLDIGDVAAPANLP